MASRSVLTRPGLIRLRYRRRKPKQGSPPEVPGFRVTKPTGRRSMRLLKGIGYAVLVVVVIIGFRGGFIPTRPAAAAGGAVHLDPDQARVSAAQFTADYLSHDPKMAPQNALRQELAPGADPAKLAFTGTGYLGTDVVIPGQVTGIDATHAVVAVQARITLAMPTGDVDEAPPTAPASPVPGRPASTATVPGGYVVTSAQWLSLQVPVVATGNQGVLVDLTGPVFSADPAPTGAPGGAPATDAAATDKTRDWARTLFTGYANGTADGAYLTAPGVSLVGLAGAVQVTDIRAWSLSDPDPAGVRHGTARVAWSFAPTADVATVQTYSVTVMTSDNRWYVTTLGPAA